MSKVNYTNPFIYFTYSKYSISSIDLKELARFLPELTEKIQLPNIDSVIDFFSSRLVDGNQSKSSGLQEFRTDMGEVISGSGRSGNEDKTTDSANNAQLPIREYDKKTLEDLYY